MTARVKHFKNPREAALMALMRFEQDGAYLNLSLPPLVEKMEGENRSLALCLAAGTIQCLNTLDWALGLFLKGKIESLTSPIRNLFRLSAYQLLYLDRIPDYAAINEAVNLACRYGHRGVAGLVNAVLRRLAAEKERLPWPDPGLDPLQYLSLTFSLPPWLARLAYDQLDFNAAEDWARSANIKPSPSVRPNMMKTSPALLIQNLSSEGIAAEISPRVPWVLNLSAAGLSPAETEAFRSGLYTVQGESSALVAPLMKPLPGEKIVDLCSAPGGKSTHIAELMEDSGTVYAVELHHSRLGLTKKAAGRLGLSSIKYLEADGRKANLLNLEKPDAVLVDAPCSGLGVIGRLPEIKWRRSPEDIYTLAALQKELLDSAALLLPSGGRLFYSVCTTTKEETLQVAADFETRHPDFSSLSLPELLPPLLQRGQDHPASITIWPHLHSMDGFFIAAWHRH